MINQLQESIISCPYCGEAITILIDELVDETASEQQYIEDCQVCCRPIDFAIAVDPDGSVRVRVASENE